MGALHRSPRTSTVHLAGRSREGARPEGVDRADDHDATLIQDGTAKVSALLAAVARRGLPHLIEANVIPAVIIVLLVSTIGIAAAIAAAFVWSMLSIGRRVLKGHPIPTVLAIATIGLSVRTAIALTSGDRLIYFLQPIVTSAALGLGLVASVLIGRPLVSRLACEFCPFTDEVAARPGVTQLFARLTLLWAGVQLVKAISSFVMFVTLPIETFVVLKTITGLWLMVAGVAATVGLALRVVRLEGLVVVRVPGHAFTPAG